MEEQKTELKMIRISEIQSQEVEWLWRPFIPYGKLTIIQGAPGDGKTMKWLMNRAYQKEHWKMPKRSLVSGRRKSTIHGIGSWIR